MTDAGRSDRVVLNIWDALKMPSQGAEEADRDRPHTPPSAPRPHAIWPELLEGVPLKSLGGDPILIHRDHAGALADRDSLRTGFDLAGSRNFGHRTSRIDILDKVSGGVIDTEGFQHAHHQVVLNFITPIETRSVEKFR
ncbi:uncharacterized protein N7473_012237 [Penicillium subrubescens]|uniref:uncharacterized protein n=1 Tax=Penicillium subrubescens TaxID=1316194 RepID=UPI0025452217|nr:uncharacterized protein N7473_012237 [Penicillium subrubescens]KAJ5881184.1 hypothetical protein N7473_012237 [Penicillium subrubescens]